MKPCNSCARCCIRYGDKLSATPAERAHWRDHRPDIFRYVSDTGDIWVDPDTQAPLLQCPFLGPGEPGKPRYCQIYADRPDDCRFYPTSVDEMQRDDCDMLETQDRRHPALAERRLRRIMRDSWKPRSE